MRAGRVGAEVPALNPAVGPVNGEIVERCGVARLELAQGLEQDVLVLIEHGTRDAVCAVEFLARDLKVSSTLPERLKRIRAAPAPHI